MLACHDQEPKHFKPVRDTWGGEDGEESRQGVQFQSHRVPDNCAKTMNKETATNAAKYSEGWGKKTRILSRDYHRPKVCS